MSPFERVAMLPVLTAMGSRVAYRLAFLLGTKGLLAMGVGASLVDIRTKAAVLALCKRWRR